MIRKAHAVEGLNPDPETILNHLGNVLYILAELHLDDRCRALDEALEFYNRINPNNKIVPTEGFETRLIHQWYYEKDKS